MSYIFKPNNIVTNQYDLIYQWKEFMKTFLPNGPGWTVTSSSDGTTYSGTGDIITSYSAFDNTSAWFLIGNPNNKQQFLFQRESLNDYISLYYSRDGYFTGGGITTRPTASDEQILINNTTFGTNSTIAHFGASNTDGYCFYMVSLDSTTVDITSRAGAGLILERVINFTDDGYIQDPYIIHRYFGSSSNNYKTNIISNENESVIYGYMNANTDLEAFVNFYIPSSNNDYGAVFPKLFGLNPYTGHNYCNAALYSRRRLEDNRGGEIKGIGKYIFVITGSPESGSIFKLYKQNYYYGRFISFGDLLLPFSETAIPITN